MDNSPNPDVWVSQLNARPEIRSAFPQSTVRFYDTTLRDGEQTVGVVLSPQQKLEIARKLDDLGISRIEALNRVTGAVSFAKQNGIRVAFFAVDSTRTDLEFLKRIYLASLEAGAAEIVVVDTIGACGPEAVEYLVRQVCQWVGNSIPVHFHGHNDFGMATACAIAAVRAGATWIQGTI